MLYLFSVIVCRTAIESCSVDRLQHACTSIRYACWSRQAFHAIHSAHSCGNTHCICTVVNCLHIPAKTPTQVATLEDWLHNFAGLIPPQKCFVKDATQPTAAFILAQFFCNSTVYMEKCGRLDVRKSGVCGAGLNRNME